MKINIFILIVLTVLISGCSNKTDKKENKCKDGNAKSCYDLGEIYKYGFEHYGVSKDTEKAISYYKKACEEKYYKACADLGKLFRSEGNIKLSNSYSIKACEGGDIRSCATLGYYLQESNITNSLFYYKKACKLKDTSSCIAIAKMYAQGKYMTKDMTIALNYYDKAYKCKWKCSIYSEEGYKLNEYLNNPLAGKKLWERGCATKCGSSCTHIGLYYYNQKSYTIANKFLLKACLINSAYACTLLSKGRELNEIIGGNPRNSVENLLKKACKTSSDNTQEIEASMQACIMLAL